MDTETEDAFRAVAAARMRSLGRVAHSLSGDPHLADDLVQTVLVRLYLAWPLRDSGNVDAWLRRTLVRAWIDTTRRPWWRRERPSADPPDTEAPTSIGDGLDPEIRDLLDRLPPRQRACVVLRFLDDMSVEQTALALGCSAGTVKSSTSRGLATIRTHLQEETRR